MYKKGLVFAAACMGMLLFGIVLISLGSILPSVMDQFNIDQLTAASLATLLPFGILLGSLVFGPVVDRYGYKGSLIICSLLVFVGLEGIAYSSEFYILQISMFLIGFGGGVLNGGTNTLVADISHEGKGANLSLLGVFFGIGALGMPVVLGLLSKTFAPGSIIAAVGFFVLIPVIYFISIKFPVPKLSQGLPVKQALGLLKESSLLLLGFILFFESAMEGIVNNWTTVYLTNNVDVSQEDALYALSLYVVGMTVTRLVLGGLLKKLPSYIVLYACLAAAFIGTLLLMNASSYGVAVAGLIMLGIGFAAGFPVILGYVGELYSQFSGTAFSIALVIALTGNMLLNYLTGSIGVEHYTTILLVSLVLMAILLKITLTRISTKIKI